MAAHNLSGDEWTRAHNACAHINHWGGETWVDESRRVFQGEEMADLFDAAAGTGKIGPARARAMIESYVRRANETAQAKHLVNVNFTKQPFGTIQVYPADSRPDFAG
jgi:hypothetical protein